MQSSSSSTATTSCRPMTQSGSIAWSSSGSGEGERPMCAAQLIPEAISDYALRHTTPLPPLLEELLATTREQLGRRVVWANTPAEATFLHMLVRSLGARRVLEVGTFT